MDANEQQLKFNMRETLIKIYKELQIYLKELNSIEDSSVGVSFTYPNDLPGIKVTISFEKQEQDGE